MLLSVARCLGTQLPPRLSGNYFQIFSLSPTFNIDLGELSRGYRRLQAHFHPDKHVKSSALEQEQAANNSAHVNKAYRCLKNPYTRARHLLEGRDQDPNVKLVDVHFLSDMMDFNDEIEMCEELDTLHRLQAHNEDAIKELYLQFQHHFQAGELQTATELLAKCKFLLQTRDRIDKHAEMLTS